VKDYKELIREFYEQRLDEGLEPMIAMDKAMQDAIDYTSGLTDYEYEQIKDARLSK